MPAATLELYHYWRSSSSWRVRWALALKEVNYKSHPINLLKQEQSYPAYVKLNPAAQVPCLVIGDNTLSESMAMIEWLEETYPEPALLPKDPWRRAEIRSLSGMVYSGIQPIGNLKVTGHYSSDAEKKTAWGRHFVEEGLLPVETMLRKYSGKWCFGDELTMADLFLVPQIYNAHRVSVDMKRFPLAQEIYERALKTKACEEAAPHNQPGAIV